MREAPASPMKSSAPNFRTHLFSSPLAIFVLAAILLSSILFIAHSGSTSSSWFSPSLSSTSSSRSWLNDRRFAAAAAPQPPANGGADSRELHGGVQRLLPSPAPPGPPGLFTGKNNLVGTRKNRSVDLKLERLELDLSRARTAIRLASRSNKNASAPADDKYVPQGAIYRNARAFHRSYLEMERLFKVYVYEEGEPPLFHDGPCKSIYSTEGRFIYNMEMETRFRTRDPEEAHVHFLPFSVTYMVKYLYQTRTFDISPIRRTVIDYVGTIARKHRYWNRSLGADHFMLSCHDWGPEASASISHLYHNSIRVLCNANTSEGFNPLKDASLPEINLRTGSIEGFSGGLSASQRPIIAFFAGGLHGPIRPLLLDHWKGRDNDVRVYEYLPRGISYYDMMKDSKFCLCPSGYEVASPRIVEAIYLECVPVIISEGYILPFSDVLDWKSFSVEVPISEIRNLKKILMEITPGQYLKLQRGVKLVQRHFVISTPPKRFDVYHMILHSIWLRRLNIRIHPKD
ncbi:unnamed protein product [Spirodela intermedia]|uniref:Exostosin GT47 domain-containing protein n=1 Tax=Spirodela intermedia TaxID=51605 RepID=A0A7I8KIS7_SPIIN|nr:unnamed protein product [Spirodela intermedia]